MRVKTIFVCAFMLAIAIFIFIPKPALQAWSSIDYSSALNAVIQFFDANACGKDVTGNERFSWRGNCHTTDGSDVGLDLSGGYHDAGDHVKFGLPQGYAASILGWMIYEYRSTFDAVGQSAYALKIEKRFCDYFLKCHPNPTTFYYQCGDGDQDHNYWGPPETQTTARPTLYVANATHPASDICGMTAAALAWMYLNYKSIDATYANNCLNAAKDLYNMGKTYQGKGGGQTYYISSNYTDDLAWAAISLYYATNDTTYRDAVKTYLGSAPNGGTWTLCWDDVSLAAIDMYAKATNDSNYKAALESNLCWWIYSCPTTPGGLKYLSNWGTLRYADTAALMAFHYAMWNGGADYYNLGLSQVDYTLGANPRGGSYICGWGAYPPKQPHHRAASGYDWNGFNSNAPEINVLTGGLVGGPSDSTGNPTDNYTDDIRNVQCNEVALDYQVGLVGSLIGAYYFGQNGPPATPSPEAAQIIDDFESGINWTCYYGGGDSVTISSGAGHPGTALVANYTGAAGGYWGVVKTIINDWTGWKKLGIDTKSINSNGVKVVLNEKGTDVVSDGEQWICTLSTGTAWSSKVMYFSSFTKRTDYQPIAQDNDGVLDLNKIKNIQIIQGTDYSDTLYVDNVKLIGNAGATPGSTPTPSASPSKTPTKTPSGVTATATKTATPSVTKTSTPSATPSATPTPTAVSTNIALNKAVTASGYTNSSEAPQYAVDGATSTKWCATNGYPYWLRINLGANYNINRWVVKHAGAGGEGTDKNTKDFKLQKSSDGASWTDVDSVTGNTANLTDRVVSTFTAQYLRLYITNAGSDNAARIYEFEAYSAAGTATPTSTSTPTPTSTATATPTPTSTTASNVALNKTATASDYTNSSEAPQFAVDGNVSTKWCATNGYPYWLRLDLGASYTIKRWVVKHAGAGGEGTDKNTKDFKLQKSSNGSTWTDVDSATGNTANITDHNVTAFSSRYIRLYITNAGADNIARIYEFELWN